MQPAPVELPSVCKICHAEVSGESALVEHLRNDHEILEVVSYVATTMVNEEERDRLATEFHRRFEQIREELVGD
jgi:hypothetical protein